MEPFHSFWFLQKPATCPCPKPNKCILHNSIPFSQDPIEYCPLYYVHTFSCSLSCHIFPNNHNTDLPEWKFKVHTWRYNHNSAEMEFVTFAIRMCEFKRKFLALPKSRGQTVKLHGLLPAVYETYVVHCADDEAMSMNEIINFINDSVASREFSDIQVKNSEAVLPRYMIIF